MSSSSDPPRKPVVVVGVSGSAASRKAVEFAAGVAGDRALLLLVCAVGGRPRRRPAQHGVWSDALRGDAYLVEDASAVLEIQRDAREIARAAGATDVESAERRGAPAATLVAVSLERGADTVVVGGHGRPRRLARTVVGRTGCATLIVDVETEDVHQLLPSDGPLRWPRARGGTVSRPDAGERLPAGRGSGEGGDYLDALSAGARRLHATARSAARRRRLTPGPQPGH